MSEAHEHLGREDGHVSRAKKKTARRVPVSETLRDTIRERGLTAYAAAKRAGVSVDAVQRFLNAERGLNLATVDRLADALDLTLCQEDSPEKQAS
jgi:plasmid maintenance system antidote protein VapI